MSICTRNARSTGLILTSYRHQILRLDIASATVYPSGINDERQFTISFLLIPDTSVINLLICQVLIPLIHQVFLTDLFYEE